MAIKINEFFQTISKDYRGVLNLPVLWTVSIEGVTTRSITTVLEEAGQSWKSKISTFDMSSIEGGILIAQEVTLPNEKSEFSIAESSQAMGGYLSPYVMNKRENFLSRTLAVNFLETQVDIEHYYFRPWMIALGIKGLIETGPNNLKATMEVKQFNNKGQLIKGFRFLKVFPVGIEGYNLKYDTTDFKIKSVSFSCQDYEQIEYDEAIDTRPSDF